MINTIEALQGLYVALGGELSDVANVTTIPEMLTAISTVAAAAAGELPAVTSDDNGKVLTVVEGDWNKANLPASGYSETTLFTGSLSSADTETLSDSIANYDALIFVTVTTDPDSGDTVEVKNPYIPTSGLIGNYYNLYFGSVNPVFTFKFTTGTSINWLCNTTVVKIIGVKF